ncbi:MAG: hypothetical protein ACI4KM_08625 [Oscillospiraceae bacterium]
MKNILKGQLFMLPRYRISHLTFIGIALLHICMTYFTIQTTPEMIPNAGVFACVADNANSMLSVVYIFILTAQFCLADFSDKTSYYEIMGGHTRLEVFFGRAIPCLVLGTLGTLVLMIIPDITATVLLGWGSDIPVGQIVIRRLLLVFPIFRLGCEFVFISFLMKNMIGVMVTGFAVYMTGWYLSVVSQSPWLGMTTISLLYQTDVWVTYGLDAGIHFSYGASLQSETVVPVILLSLAAAAICLYMGYFFFAKDDMN